MVRQDRKVLEQLWQTYRIVKGVPVKPRGSEVTTEITHWHGAKQ